MPSLDRIGRRPGKSVDSSCCASSNRAHNGLKSTPSTRCEARFELQREPIAARPCCQGQIKVSNGANSEYRNQYRASFGSLNFAAQYSTDSLTSERSRQNISLYTVNGFPNYRFSSTSIMSMGLSLRFSGKWLPAGVNIVSPARNWCSSVLPSGNVNLQCISF
jgi:hypothetical protein